MNVTWMIVRDNQTVPGPVCTYLQAAIVDCWITEIGSSPRDERSDPPSEYGCEGTAVCVETIQHQSGGAPGPQRKSPGAGCSPALLSYDRLDTLPSSFPSGRKLLCVSVRSHHQQTPLFRSPGTEQIQGRKI